MKLINLYPRNLFLVEFLLHFQSYAASYPYSCLPAVGGCGGGVLNVVVEKLELLV